MPAMCMFCTIVLSIYLTKGQRRGSRYSLVYIQINQEDPSKTINFNNLTGQGRFKRNGINCIQGDRSNLRNKDSQSPICLQEYLLVHISHPKDLEITKYVDKVEQRNGTYINYTRNSQSSLTNFKLLFCG